MERAAWLALPVFIFFTGCAPRAVVPLPTPSPTPFDYDHAIDAARRQNRPLQALYLVEAAARAEGWTAALAREAGDLWLTMDDPAQALVYWQRALSQSPEDAALLRAIAQASIEQGDWRGAKDALESLAGVSPDDYWAQLQLGLIEAPLDPRSAAVHLRAAMEEPGYRELAAPLLDMITNDSGDPLLAMRVGLALADAELWSFAELAFEQSAALHAPFPLAMAYRGYARDQQGLDGGAWLDEAIALDPQDAQIQLLYGLHQRLMGEAESSLNALAEAVALDPENPAYQAELATAYRLLGDLERAEYWLRSAVSVSEDATRFVELLRQFYADYPNYRPTAPMPAPLEDG